jgi:hypothetical protein
MAHSFCKQRTERTKALEPHAETDFSHALIRPFEQKPGSI